MLRHGILIRRLVADIETPAYLVGVVGRGHVHAPVVEQDQVTLVDNQGYRLAVGRQVLGVDFQETGSGIALLVPRLHPLSVRARHHVQAPVLQGRVHEGDPDRNDRIGVGIGPVGLVLVPGHHARGHPRYFGARVVHGVGKDLGTNQRFNRVQNDRIGHELVVARIAVPPTASKDQKVRVGQVGEQIRQPPLERTVFHRIRHQAVGHQFPGDGVHLALHRGARRFEIRVVKNIGHDEVALCIVKVYLLVREAAAVVAAECVQHGSLMGLGRIALSQL